MWAYNGSRLSVHLWSRLTLCASGDSFLVMARFHPMSPARSLALMIYKTDVLAITTQCSWVRRELVMAKVRQKVRWVTGPEIRRKSSGSHPVWRLERLRSTACQKNAPNVAR